MKHNLLKSVIISVILLMGVSNAWADDGDFYNTYLTYTFGTTNGSAEDQDNGTGLSKDLGTLKSGSFKITAVYLKCWDDWGSNYKSSGGQMCYSKDGGGTQYLQGFSRSNKGSGSNNYEWRNTNANLTIANSTDKSGSYTLSCWFQTWGWGDRFFPKSSGNYTFTYKIAPPSVKGFTVTPSGNKLSGSGTPNDPYIIKYNGSLTLTLSGSQNHTDANSTIQYNTSGTWNTTKSRTISNITSTVVKNITVKARYKNNSDANLCGAESSQTIYYRSEQIYTVTFNANGHGTAPAAQTVSQGSKATQPAAPTATGYTFGGWYKEAGCTNAFDFNTAINANITLYAKWTANKYTVTLSDQGATTAGTASVQATYDAAMPSATMPKKTGYTFGGYYTSNNGGGTQYYNANGASARNWAIASNSTLYAKWTANQYTITYKDQGNVAFSGTHASTPPTKHTYGTATTLKDATKTGYTFGGWHTDQACTNKVTSLGATAYTAAITLYAKWTINQYTLTYSAGEGGSVTGTHKSGAKYDYNTSIKLTATPEGENAFAQWVDGSGGKVSTANPYTVTLTSNKTLKAEFSKPTTVYLKPEGYWPDASARFAIIAYSAGKQDQQVNMQSLGCENEYYSANVPAGYTTYKYVRINPSNTSQIWNETGVYNVQDGKNKLHVATRIYFKPDVNWKSDNARFAVYFYKSSNNSEYLWRDLTAIGDDYYVCNNPGTAYDRAIFCRMDPSNKANEWGTKWNQTNDLYIDINSIGGKNLYTITKATGTNMEGDLGTWSTHWETFTTPTYDVTIKPTIHGTYSVVCNGRTYLAPNKEEIVIPNVPVGTTLTIQDVKPNNETEYTSDIIYKESANAAYQTLVGNQITVCGNTTIDENFITKNPHTVYLRVPTTIEAAWNDDDQGLSKGANCVYYTHIMAGGIHIMDNVTNSINGEDGYSYYQLTIPAGYRTFCFQRKSESEPQNYEPRNYTKDFTHILPFINGLNCFTILGSDDDDYYYGEWGTLLQDNDYRLLYIEQKVEEENGHPKTIVTKAHPSDIIKYNDTRTTYSLHIYNEVENGENGMNDPEILVQQWNGSNWITKERHMVFGPLHAGFDKAAMPGRRDAAGDPVLRYDNGIENIKIDTHADNGSGVWNFIVIRDKSKNFAGLDLTQTARYKGDYYVRTDCADGGWDRYTVNGNHMTRSDISKRNSNYSHYFCKWIGEAGVNVKYTIANDYGIAISDTLEADKTDLWGKELATKMVDDDQLLPAKANVRFSWNEKTNGLHRAYIAGATNAEDRFLVLGGKTGQIYNAAGQSLTEGANNSDRYGLKANEEIFSDIENWVYQTDVQITPGAELQVTAKYNNQVQYFVGKEGVFNNTILQGSGTEKYLVRLLYDFKTNELISAYVPGASTHVDKISTNLMLIRQNYNEAKQLVFNNGDMSTRENRKAYGVIEFTEDYLTNEKIPYLKRCLYWVSFPFDVNLSEAFGSLVYGKHWLIQEYDGARRAAEGLWKESESFWKLHWEPNITLEAGLGYVIEIDINQMIKDNIIDTKDAKQQIAALYFPSNTPITREIINQASYTVNIPDHKCEIVHTGEFGDRTIRDSHWNVIGVPSYVNTGATFSDQTYALNNVVKYYYQWEGEVDKYTAMEATNHAYNFHSMYAYMVQYAGDITWNSVLLDEKPAQIAAKKNSVTNEHAMRLELQQNNILLDKTFVRLQDDVATPAFDFNYDLCKITNKGANIYSIITEEASPVEVAANVLPIKETIIPIGIKLDAAGEYTFAMPDGTDGIVVELIDYQANTATNLLFNDYTVSLPKGTFENRFALSVKPDKTATSLENIFNKATGDEVKKYIIDGVLYMQKDGVLYDAQGHIVR